MVKLDFAVCKLNDWSTL